MLPNTADATSSSSFTCRYEISSPCSRLYSELCEFKLIFGLANALVELSRRGRSSIVAPSIWRTGTRAVSMDSACRGCVAMVLCLYTNAGRLGTKRDLWIRRTAGASSARVHFLVVGSGSDFPRDISNSGTSQAIRMPFSLPSEEDLQSAFHFFDCPPLPQRINQLDSGLAV